MLDTLTPAELEAIASEPYEPRGILHSEMALIIHICRRLGIEVVIESGRARGQSTYMLAKYLPGCEIHSVELRDHPDEAFAQERLKSFANVSLWRKDAFQLVPHLCLSEGQGRPVAVLLDGPKGARAVDLLKMCFNLVGDEVRVGFIHDMRRLDHGAPSPHRADAIARLPNHAFSDDPRIISAASWMDATIIAAGGPAGPAHEAVFGSYGPTVGVFINPDGLNQQSAISPLR